MRASHLEHPQSSTPLPVCPPYLLPEDASTLGPGWGLSEQRPLALPSSGGPVTPPGAEAFLGLVSAARPWARTPASPSWLGPAPRAPASKLAPDAVAIETGSPHKNKENKKEAPEMMGPSWGRLQPTWAKPSTLTTRGPLPGDTAASKDQDLLGMGGEGLQEGLQFLPLPLPRGLDPCHARGGRTPTK